ncbi:MAG: 50S ribosomal protein L16 [Parcubacteria group bacterium GW2011_GWA2_47_8b]|nr:MAG: 50S ribosomal protein L16 [Parcubacteria group bacterium GW2011_GWA2_47_8b]KKU93270.1 MAG: 50S ribosomal protein L16 [Parcubacteria group bacterium GW2011_GWA1_48_11b]OGY65061.1 MAG: 50S ribosomal protein L16 [Candidatus Harrisonbacteria bacterium RIFCSPHIGHO2_12_FULL_48_16]OGY68595.1 MAG: 50S ribosomal protein L16 [Candidatus Harrisonbacteria bacterium RIFOXYA1_FULL_48_8]
MLVPKKVKHRKWQKGRSLGRLVETRGTKLSFGSFGLKAETAAWVNSRQIEAARRTISNFIKREGKVWIRIFPDKPITKRPPEITMGGGKGSVDHYVFPVKPGRVLFEMDGVKPEIAKEALRLAGHKLPLRTRVISK